MTFQKLGKEFEELRDEYRRGMPEKLARVEKLWAIVAASASVGRPFQELCRELHTIAGSAGSFEIPGLSEAALAAENLLVSTAKVGEPERRIMEKLLEEMRGASAAR